MNNDRSIAETQFAKLGLSNDALLMTAKRHEATLTRVNVDPFREIGGLDDDYFHWFEHLFLMTFFYDYCLDRADEEQYPEALFISINMFSEYRDYVRLNHGTKGLSILERNNAQQVYYQMIERQWLHPSEYHRAHPNYGKYFRKQILCLTQLELLTLNEKTKSIGHRAIELYKCYWNLVLLIDDIMDAEADIKDQTITPIIGDFYARYGRMPTPANVDELRECGKAEYNRLFDPFEKAAYELGIYGYLDIICNMWNKI